MDLYLSNHQRLSKNWFTYSDDRLEIMRKELRSEAKSHILNVSETEYKRYLISKYELCPLRLYEDTIRIDEPVKTKHERSSLNEHERYPYYWLCSVACVIEGTVDLWGVVPTQHAFGGRPEFSASAKLLTFLFRINSMNADEYNQQKDVAFKYLVGHTNYINIDVSRFNANLPSEVEISFTKLKEEYKKENNFFEAIMVTQNPVAPKTYSVPLIERRPAIQKPAVTTKLFKSEPSVDKKTYNDIIDCLMRTGLSMERKPSLYVGKGEEALRDVFLMQLEINFLGGSATGETFNHGGKTDILLRNTDNTNLFVGECKIWKGAKHYLEAIDQLLEYLSWGDSKAAVIIFVKDTSMSAAINMVNQMTITHQSAIKLVSKEEERSFQYIFSLPQDMDKQVTIQIMLFHFDKLVEGRTKS